MSEIGYLCIGGPKDGARYEHLDDEQYFVCEQSLPSSHMQHMPDGVPVVESRKRHVYALRLLKGRLLWVYQE